MPKKTPAIIVATGLALALISGLPSAAAAPSASTVGAPQIGGLSQIGGPAGYAQANGWPAATGQASPQYDGQITTTLAGRSGTVSVGAGPDELSVGAAVGEATGAETLTATGTKIQFTGDVLPFFSVADMIALMPQLTFEFSTRTSSGSLVYQGHYALDLVTGRVTADGAEVSTPANGHPAMSQTNSSGQDAHVTAPGNPIVEQRIAAANSACVLPGTATLNSGTPRVYTGFAQSTPLTLSAPVPVSFGYRFSQLTTGHQLTVGLDQVFAQGGTWAAGLASAPRSGVAISFDSFDWRAVFDSAALNRLDSGIQQGFASAFGKGLSYDQLVEAITTTTDAQMATYLDQFVTEFIAGIADGVTSIRSATFPSLPDYPTLNGALQMDQILGTTSWPTDLREPPKTMYPNLRATVASKLTSLVKARARAQWYDMVRSEISGNPVTTTITRTFVPAAMTSLVATDVSYFGRATAVPSSTAPSSTTPPTTVTPPSSTAPTTSVRLSSDDWRVGYPKAKQAFRVTSGTRWTAASDSKWLKVRGRSGPSGGLFKLIATKNAGGTRVGHVTVSSGGDRATVTVTQTGRS